MDLLDQSVADDHQPAPGDVQRPSLVVTRRVPGTLPDVARLLHLSDTHLVGPGSVSDHPEIDPQARLVQVLEAAAAAGPYDAVVLTGDIADDGSYDAVRRARELVEPIAPVVAAVPGNHDRTDAVVQVFGTEPARVGRWQLIGVATNVPGQIPGRGSPALEALSLCAGPTVLLMHHPLRSPSTHPWFALAGATELEDRLLSHDVPLLLLSGHTHEAYEAVIGQVRLLGAPSTWYGIAHTGPTFQMHAAPTGARVVELADEGTSSTHLVLT